MVLVPKTKQREHDALVAELQAKLDRCTNGDEQAELFRCYEGTARGHRAIEAIFEKSEQRRQGVDYSHIDPFDPFWEDPNHAGS